MDNSENIIQAIFSMAGPRPKDGAYQSGQHMYTLARGRMSSSRSRWPRTSARSAADVIVAGLILVHGTLQDQPRRYIKCVRLHKLMSVLFLFQGRVILGWVAWD